MAAPGGQVFVEPFRSWVDATPVSFGGNNDRKVVGDVLQFSQGADEAVRERLFLRARPEVNLLQTITTSSSALLVRQ